MKKECEDFLNECKQLVELEREEKRRKKIRKNRLMFWILKKEFPTMEMKDEYAGKVDICGFEFSLTHGWRSKDDGCHIEEEEGLHLSYYRDYKLIYVKNKKDFAQKYENLLLAERGFEAKKKEEAQRIEMERQTINKFYTGEREPEATPNKKDHFPLIFFLLFAAVTITSIIVLSNK